MKRILGLKLLGYLGWCEEEERIRMLSLKLRKFPSLGSPANLACGQGSHSSQPQHHPVLKLGLDLRSCPQVVESG